MVSMKDIYNNTRARSASLELVFSRAYEFILGHSLGIRTRVEKKRNSRSPLGTLKPFCPFCSAFTFSKACNTFVGRSFEFV